MRWKPRGQKAIEAECEELMKRKIMACILAFLLSAALLAGCGGAGGAGDSGSQSAQEEAQKGAPALAQAAGETQQSLLQDAGDSSNGKGESSDTDQDQADGSVSDGAVGADTADAASDVENGSKADSGRDDTENGTQTQTAAQGEVPVGHKLEGADYVLIYDPLIYDENDPQQIQRETSLDTGDLASQIVTGSLRADDMMDSLDMPVLLSQGQINRDVDQGQIQ